MNDEQINRRDIRQVQPRVTRAAAVGAAALGAFAFGTARPFIILGLFKTKDNTLHNLVPVLKLNAASN